MKEASLWLWLWLKHIWLHILPKKKVSLQFIFGGQQNCLLPRIERQPGDQIGKLSDAKLLHSAGKRDS